MSPSMLSSPSRNVFIEGCQTPWRGSCTLKHVENNLVCHVFSSQHYLRLRLNSCSEIKFKVLADGIPDTSKQFGNSKHPHSVKLAPFSGFSQRFVRYPNCPGFSSSQQRKFLVTSRNFIVVIFLRILATQGVLNSKWCCSVVGRFAVLHGGRGSFLLAFNKRVITFHTRSIFCFSKSLSSDRWNSIKTP